MNLIGKSQRNGPKLLLPILVLLLSLVINATLAGRQETFQKLPPVVSILALCLFLVIVTASSRDDLISAGLLLVVAATLHNVIGMILGYWLAFLAGIRGINRRTVAFEVGLQNSGTPLLCGGLVGGRAVAPPGGQQRSVDVHYG